MAATFSWGEANGAGQTLSSGVSNVNWKNTDDVATAYSSSPITAGSNSYEKWQFGIFSGSYNQISNGYFDHTATAFGAGLTLKAFPSLTASGLALWYTTPATTANALLTKDMTSVNGSFPTSANVVMFSGTTPNASTPKAATTTANPAYTNYLTTQLQTTGSAAAGDTAQVTLTLRYDEN